MTAAGRAQVIAAQELAAALNAFGRSLARTKNAGPAEYALLGLRLHACLGLLASTINSTGYDAARQAADPDELQYVTHTAACFIQDGANLTLPIRAAWRDDANLALPAVQAGYTAWRAFHDLRELAAEHRRADRRLRLQDYMAVLLALHAACEPLAAAVTAITPRLTGIAPDWSSVWCEDFTGDLPAAYRGAARECRAGGRVLEGIQ